MLIGRAEFPTLIEADATRDVTIWFKNTGNVELKNVLASYSPSEGIMIMGSSSSTAIGTLAPEEVRSITLSVLGNREITPPQQSIQVDAKYEYVTEKAPQQGSGNEKILLPALIKVKSAGGGGGGKKPKPDISVPNIIISNYSFGAEQVAAGAEFPLTIRFKNTSAIVDVENIVMSMETSEGLTITSSSNTAYLARLGMGEEYERVVKMKVLPSAKSGPARIDVTFKYDYVDGEKRNAVTANERLFIPIYQPDRMNISLSPISDGQEVGKEATVSFSYMNKGKSDAANLTASLQGDIKALSRVQNIGNIEPGRSGTIDFIVTPEKAGTEKFSVVASYEDGSGQTIEQTFPVSLTVAEAPEVMPEGDFPMEEMEEPEKSGADNKLMLYGLGALVPAAALTAMAIKRGRARKRRQMFDDGFDAYDKKADTDEKA